MFVALVLLAGSTSARSKGEIIVDQEVMEEQRSTGDTAEVDDPTVNHPRRKRSWAAPNCPNPIPNPQYRTEPYWYERLLGIYNYGGPPYICP